MYVKTENNFFFAKDWPRKKICTKTVLPPPPPTPHRIKWTVPVQIRLLDSWWHRGRVVVCLTTNPKAVSSNPILTTVLCVMSLSKVLYSTCSSRLSSVNEYQLRLGDWGLTCDGLVSCPGGVINKTTKSSQRWAYEPLCSGKDLAKGYFEYLVLPPSYTRERRDKRRPCVNPSAHASGVRKTTWFFSDIS